MKKKPLSAKAEERLARIKEARNKPGTTSMEEFEAQMERVMGRGIERITPPPSEKVVEELKQKRASEQKANESSESDTKKDS